MIKLIYTHSSIENKYNFIIFNTSTIIIYNHFFVCGLPVYRRIESGNGRDQPQNCCTWVLLKCTRVFGGEKLLVKKPRHPTQIVRKSRKSQSRRSMGLEIRVDIVGGRGIILIFFSYKTDEFI